MAASDELRALRGQASELYDQARDGTLDSKKAAVLVQVMHLRIRLIEVENDVVRTELLEARIEQLEGQAGRRWPAA